MEELELLRNIADKALVLHEMQKLYSKPRSSAYVIASGELKAELDSLLRKYKELSIEEERITCLTVLL